MIHINVTQPYNKKLIPELKKEIKILNEKSKNFTGLICLKGGNLNTEIAESGCAAQTYDIAKIFDEDFFKEKYIVFVSL